MNSITNAEIGKPPAPPSSATLIASTRPEGARSPPPPTLPIPRSDDESAKAALAKIGLPFYRSVLKDGTPVILKRLVVTDVGVAPNTPNAQATHQQKLSAFSSDVSLTRAMRELFAHEANTLAESFPIEYHSYYTHYDTFVLVVDVEREQQTVGGKEALRKRYVRLHKDAEPFDTNPQRECFRLSDPTFVGCFYVKPNWPGRCSHVCNGGYLVAPCYLNYGAAFIMGEMYRHIAKALGYHYSIFNLVFETDFQSNELWHKLGFSNSGRVQCAGIIRIDMRDDQLIVAMRRRARRLREAIIARKMSCGGARPYTAEEIQWLDSPLFAQPQRNGDCIAVGGCGGGGAGKAPVGSDSSSAAAAGAVVAPPPSSPPSMAKGVPNFEEVYVGALQWSLDLRRPLRKIPAPWISTTSDLMEKYGRGGGGSGDAESSEKKNATAAQPADLKVTIPLASKL